MYSVIPLFKSHFSLGKSILTLEKATGDVNNYPVSIFDLLLQNKLNTLVLVEDNVSSLLQASKHAAEHNVRLIFGLRLDMSENAEQKDEAILTRRAKYIVFAKNSQGYKALIKIWSFASQNGFYYSPSIDFKTLKSLWTSELVLAVPFYDSFLHLNTLCSYTHVPELEAFSPVTFFIEENEMPFDEIIYQKVKQYCSTNNYGFLPAQSIYYKSEKDFLAYVAFKCLHNRGTSQKSTLEAPELDHMSSSCFNFDRWMKRNGNA